MRRESEPDAPRRSSFELLADALHAADGRVVPTLPLAGYSVYLGVGGN